MQLPNQYTYDFEIQTIITMFLEALSDIIVKRYDQNTKQAKDQIKTRIVYAPKQRVLADLLDKDQNLQLPVVACYLGGINRDPSRVFNKILGTFNTSFGSGAAVNDKTPLPIDLVINVTIAARFQQDMDQILSRIIPYVNPYFVLSWRTPNRPDFEIRSNVFWNGSVNISYPFDVTSNQVAKVLADLSFTIKGWIFQALPADSTGVIYTINSTYNAQANGGIPQEFLLDENFTSFSSDTFDFIRLNGTPPRPQLIAPYTAKVGKLQQFKMFGSSFINITNVYLSGAPLSTVLTTQNPFSSVPALSAKYPTFEGFALPSTMWSFNNDNFITFIMPSAASTGFVDIIVENEAGYGSLTQFTRVNTFNPFLSSTSEYDNYIPYQFPFLSGIKVIQ